MFLAIIGRILAYGSSIYALILIARVIFDWVRILAPRWVPSGPVLFVADWVYRLTDPPSGEHRTGCWLPGSFCWSCYLG